LCNRRKNQKFTKVTKIGVIRDLSPVQVDIEKFLNQLKNCEEELKTSEFLKGAEESLKRALQQKEIREIICLGIGKISECSIAKHQLALISVIKKLFDIPAIKFFDPVLSADEKKLLELLQFEVLTENTEGKYLAQQPTLFYLPHCPKQITNNLLFTNWNPENIQNLFLICNSFSSVVQSTPERLLRPNAHYILEINPYVSEIEFENNFRYSDIFNDFSAHSFTSEKLQNLPSTFWKDHPEPRYSEEDLELITNGSD